jgi:hypothetical protein
MPESPATSGDGLRRQGFIQESEGRRLLALLHDRATATSASVVEREDDG